MQSNSEHSRDVKKSRRFRSAFTTEQTNYLESAYKTFPYVDREERKQLSTFLKIGERPIKIWFQNRRMKEKRDSHKEFDDEIRANVQKSGQDQLNNVSTLPSTNDSRSYSLPILPLTADSTVHINMKGTNNVESCKQKPPKITESHTNKTSTIQHGVSAPKANFYKENRPSEQEQYLGPYFYQQPTVNSILISTTDLKKKKSPTQKYDLTSSAEFSIDLCKKYKERDSTENAVIGNIATDDQKKKPNGKKVPKTEKKHFCLPKYVPPKKKSKITNPLPPHEVATKVNMDKPVYYPIMPNVYASPYVAPDGVLWKPVNFMPVLATNRPPMTIGNQAIVESNKNCTCNCHASSPHLSSQNPYTQYLITVPFPHTSPNI